MRRQLSTVILTHYSWAETSTYNTHRFCDSLPQYC